MTSWQRHAVRNWLVGQHKENVRLHQNLIIGKLPCEWQVKRAFQELIKCSPIIDVVRALIEIRKWEHGCR